MNDTTYLFIDGGYLRSVYRDRFEPIFGPGYPIDYRIVMETYSATRSFYYDCIDDNRRDDETDEELQKRVEAQEKLFASIDKVEGMHVCYGHLAPSSKKKHKQQKEVDVALAVDMLTHSFYKNISQAVLLSGDRDFKPVVESAVRLGTRVRVSYDPRSGSKELARAADYETEIDLVALCRWIKFEKYETRDGHFPIAMHYGDQSADPLNNMSPAATSVRHGVVGLTKLALSLGQIDQNWYASIKLNRRDYSVHMFHDQAKLLGYLVAQYGEIVW